MTDIDFEELDRAVQSAIDDFSNEDEFGEAEVKEVSLPETLVDSIPDLIAAAPVSAPTTAPVSNPAPTTVPDPTPVSTPGPASAKLLFSAPRPVSKRSGRSLDSFSSPKANVGLTPTVKPEIVQPAATNGPVIDIVNPVRRQPVHELKSEPQSAPKMIEEPVPADEPELEIAELNFTEEIKESPFVENYQVDKRPLGAFSELSNRSEPVKSAVKPASVATESKELPIELPKELPIELPVPDEPVAATTPNVEAPTYVGGVDEASELPPELQQDILAVEATGMLHEQDPLSDENVGLEAIKEPVSLKGAEGSEKTEETIYTSEAYTKPLEHPKKQKSGWLKVVLIILLLLIGVTGGVAVYYFMG